MQRMFWGKKEHEHQKERKKRKRREKKKFDLPNTKIYYKVKIAKTQCYWTKKK